MRARDFIFVIFIVGVLIAGVGAAVAVAADGNARSERCAAKGGVYLSSGDCVRPGVVIEIDR